MNPSRRRGSDGNDQSGARRHQGRQMGVHRARPLAIRRSATRPRSRAVHVGVWLPNTLRNQGIVICCRAMAGCTQTPMRPLTSIPARVLTSRECPRSSGHAKLAGYPCRRQVSRRLKGRRIIHLQHLIRRDGTAGLSGTTSHPLSGRLPGKSGVSGGIVTIYSGKGRLWGPSRRRSTRPGTACEGNGSPDTCPRNWG